MLKVLIAMSILIIPIDLLAQQLTAQKRARANEERIEQLQTELDSIKASIVTPSSESANSSKNLNKLTWSLSGRIHRVMMVVEDGAETNGFFMDSDQGPTMLRVDAKAPQSSNGWSIKGRLELGIQSNRAYQVSQDEPNPGTDLTVRDADIKIAHQSYGEFSIGRGSSAAWVVPEVDVSGTAPAALLAVGNFAPGMKFVDSTTGELTDIRVHHYFADTERLMLVDRVRYDSPSFYGGLTLSGTISADNRWDTALRYYPELDNWLVKSAITYQSKPFAGVENRLDVIISAQHKQTGVSFTAGHSLAKKELLSAYANGFVVKTGVQKSLFTIGASALSIDYSVGEDIRSNNDDVSSIGVVATQNWDALNTYLYVGLRRYSVNPADMTLEDLNVAAVGIMLSF